MVARKCAAENKIRGWAQVRASMRNGPASVGVLDGGNETLRAPAFGAFVDPMHKARLFRFGAGKPHLRTTFNTEQALKWIVTFGL